MNQRSYFASATADVAERERLACLEQVLDPGSTRHLAALGVASGWTFLEAGAGGGSIARWLADRVAPDGRVVAMDIDTRFVDAIEHPHLEVRRGDVLQDDLGTRRYDLVHCRFLLLHLANPERTVARMATALKRGACLLIEEPDFRSYRSNDPAHPASADFTRIVQSVFERATTRGVFDAYLGCRVRSLLERSGLSNVMHEGRVRSWYGGEAEAREHQLSLAALMRAGVCSQYEADVLEAALVDPAFTFTGHTVFAAWGRRPS